MVDRAVSPLLGLVLLVGMVAVVSLGLLMTAGQLMDSGEQEIEKEQVEQAMVELNTQLYAVTQSPDTARDTNLAVGQYGAVARENTGEITIESPALETDINTTIGTVEWEGDDGTKIASEAGAVFRETGTDTRLVSAPPVRYDYRTNTFSFPVVTIAGDQDLGTGDVTLRQATTTTFDDGTVVKDDNITVTVESQYCVGWETYFIQEAGAGSIQESCNGNGRVVAQIGYINVGDSFQSGVSRDSDGDLHDDKDHFGEVTSGKNKPLDGMINELIYDAKHPNESGMDVEELDAQTGTIEAGTYFVEGDLHLADGETTTVDLTDGNVTFIVEGAILGDGNINVTDTENRALRIYAGGDRLDIGGDVCTAGCTGDAEHIQIYGTSEMALKFGPGDYQGAQYEGLIYAASDEDKQWYHEGRCDGYQFAHQGGKENITGSVVAYSACSHSNSQEDLVYDDSLGEVQPVPEEISLPPELTYLNVVKYEIEMQAN